MSLFTKPLTNVAIKYGLVGGLISILLLLALFYTGKNPFLYTRKVPFGIVLIPLFIFFAIKEFRDFKNNRTLHFWQGLILGFACYLIIALISGGFTWLFLGYHPEMLQDIIDTGLQMIEQNKEEAIKTFGKATPEELINTTKNTTAYVIALEDFILKMLLGFVATLIISLVLRKNTKIIN